jgi:hypothetical protein
MSRVVIVVDAKGKKIGELGGTLPTTMQMVEPMKQAIALPLSTPITLEVISSIDLAEGLLNPIPGSNLTDDDIIWCPLTLDVPKTINFPGQNIFQACNNLTSLRQWVQQKFGCQTSDSNEVGENLYLPIVFTAKGPIYGEVIGETATTKLYQQPLDLLDQQRQPLYHLAYQLLQFLSASPGVYLLKFSYSQQDMIFDCLLPFPDLPAIASIGVQEPNLFTCHWHCLTNQPIIDLTIIPKSE